MNAQRPFRRDWQLPRFSIVFALVCTLLIAPLVVQRVTAAASNPRIAVFGDSISARYNDKPGNSRQAWWSIVGRHYKIGVKTFAQSGSGYVRDGRRCTGNRFGDRVDAVARSSPRIVIVEGGRNDWAYCTGRALSETSNAQVKAAVDRFLTKLKRALPTTKIYVLGPPWGTRDASQRSRINSIIKSSAKRHQMLFIDTQGVFEGKRTLDGTHPNRVGSKALGNRVIEAIGPQFP